MQLDFALLADAVSFTDDEKLTIVGAGVDTVVAPSLPTVHAQVVLVLRGWVSEDEARQAHRVDVVILGPDGNQVGSTSSVVKPAPEPAIALGRELPRQRIGMGAVLNMISMPLHSYGVYRFVVSWDGEPLRTLDLLVVEAPPSAPG